MDNYWKAQCVRGGCGSLLCNSFILFMVLRDLLPEMPGLGDVFTAGLKWKLSLVDELWRSITTTERKQSTSNLLLGNVSSIFIFRPNIIYIEINNWVFISLTNTKLSELFFSALYHVSVPEPHAHGSQRESCLLTWTLWSGSAKTTVCCPGDVPTLPEQAAGIQGSSVLQMRCGGALYLLTWTSLKEQQAPA